MNVKSLITLLILLTVPHFVLAQENLPGTEEEQFREWALGIWNSLDRQTGKIKIPEAKATFSHLKIRKKSSLRSGEIHQARMYWE